MRWSYVIPIMLLVAVVPATGCTYSTDPDEVTLLLLKVQDTSGQEVATFRTSREVTPCHTGPVWYPISENRLLLETEAGVFDLLNLNLLKPSSSLEDVTMGKDVGAPPYDAGWLGTESRRTIGFHGDVGLVITYDLSPSISFYSLMSKTYTGQGYNWTELTGLTGYTYSGDYTPGSPDDVVYIREVNTTEFYFSSSLSNLIIQAEINERYAALRTSYINRTEMYLYGEPGETQYDIQSEGQMYVLDFETTKLQEVNMTSLDLEDVDRFLVTRDGLVLVTLHTPRDSTPRVEFRDVRSGVVTRNVTLPEGTYAENLLEVGSEIMASVTFEVDGVWQEATYVIGDNVTKSSFSISGMYSLRDYLVMTTTSVYPRASEESVTDRQEFGVASSISFLPAPFLFMVSALVLPVRRRR